MRVTALIFGFVFSISIDGSLRKLHGCDLTGSESTNTVRHAQHGISPGHGSSPARTSA
jgi:hypothetical protein